MRAKATVELQNLPDELFFQRVAEGMRLVVKNASSLLRDARVLHAQGRLRGADALEAPALEEIGKFLILLDAVRCPRTPQARFATHLRRCGNHLPKGLYVSIYDGAPADFAEVRRRVDEDRAQFFLDGPNDVDWIFRNQITGVREEILYVDYVVRDEGASWITPSTKYSRVLAVADRLTYRRKAHRVALALFAAGFATPEVLKIVAEIWRPIVVEDGFSWSRLKELNIEMLKRMESSGLLRASSREVLGTIAEDWLFPLYGLDLQERGVSLQELRERQRRWAPDGW